MELSQITWESLLLMDGHRDGADTQPTLRRSLLPAPLRIGSVSTSPSQYGSYRSPSPPISPAPTLLVSVQTPQHTRSMSGQLSLHEYRRKLSHPDVQGGTTAAPRRMLKRKPKTINLNNRQGNPTPLSPPATPPAPDALAPSPPLSPDLISEHLTFSPGYSNASNPARSCEVSPIDGSFLDFLRTTPYSPLTENHPYDALIENKTPHWTLTTLRDSIRQIPIRFTTHTKSASESALPRTLRHRGVSFEILTPRRYTSSPMAQTPDGTAKPMNRYMLTPTDMEIHQRIKSPLPKLRRRSASLGAERRCTPSRALFEDLPTAYSSITSGASNKTKLFHHSVSSDENLPLSPSGTTAYDDQAMILGAQQADDSVCSDTSDLPTGQAVLEEISTAPGDIDDGIHPCNAESEPSKLVKRSPGCPRIRPIISTFLNQHQPNLHGARGRIEKPKTISNIINRRPNSRPGSAHGDIEQQIEERSAPQPESVQHEPDNLHRTLHEISTPHHHEASDVDNITAPQDIRGESPAPQPSAFSFQESNHLEEWKSFVLTGTTDQVSSEDLPKSMRRTSIFGPNFSRPMSSRSRHRKASRRTERRPQTSDVTFPQEAHPNLPRLSTPSLRCSEDRQGEQREMASYSMPLPQPFSPIEDVIITRAGSQLDMGPGSSQSPSTNRLSQHTVSSMALGSPQYPKSMLPFEQKEKKSHPFFHAHLGSPRAKKKRGGNLTVMASHKGKQSISSVLDGDSDIEVDEGGSEKDWETVTESQMFRPRCRIPISNLESGSSLANYSSAGTLANRSLMDIPLRPLQGSDDLRSPLNNRSHRFRRPSWMHTSRQRRFPEISAPSFPRHLYSMSEFPRDPEALFNTVPPLMASTAQLPAPRASSSSYYHHPTPLREPHANPFQSTPPSLNEQPSESYGKAGRERSGFVSAIRSSKLNLQNNESNNLFSSGHSAGPIRSLRPLPGHGSMESSAWWTRPALNTMTSQQPFHSTPFSSNIRGVRDRTSLHSHHLTAHHPTSTTQNIPATDIISSKNTLPVTSHTTQTPSLALRTPDATYQDIELGTLTRTRHRSIPARSRVSSLTSLVSGTSNPRNPPGSLYLSIRAARDRARNHRHNRTLTNNSTSTTNEHLLSTRPDTRSSSRGETRRDSTMDSYEAGAERVSSPRSFFAMSPSMYSRPPTRSQSVSTSRKIRSPKPDDILRERLDRIETASIVLSNHSPSLHEGCVRSPWTTCQPAKQFTITHGASSLFATIDEEVAVLPDAYCSTYGRHVFPEPPRLTPQPYRGQRRHQQGGSPGSAGGTEVSAGNGSLSAQRKLGRQLIILFSLVIPFGWFVVAYIGFEGKMADSLIRWRSNGAISEFHVKEKYWASQLAISYGMLTFIALLVVLTICLTAL
ncbi:hypothetical protein MferCBS49748_001032 [Microsporum ferrugineum]